MTEFSTKEKTISTKNKRLQSKETTDHWSVIRTVARRGVFALGFESLGHGGLRGESTLFGDIGQSLVRVLVNEANGMAHTMLTYIE